MLTSAIRRDPGAAADLTRAAAESLAMSGASAEDIGQAMLQALAAGLAGAGDKDGGGSGSSSDDILDIVETVAGVLADAGARPEDVAEALKAAMGAPGVAGNPELAGELAKTMAKALSAVGASGEDITRCLKEALEEQGFSKDKVAKLALEGVASSGAAPEDIAASIQKLISETGKKARKNALVSAYLTKYVFLYCRPAP